MIVGAVLDGQGRPICCELWPGNTADVSALIPVVALLNLSRASEFLYYQF